MTTESNTFFLLPQRRRGQHGRPLRRSAFFHAEAMATVTVLAQVPAFAPAVPTVASLPFVDEAIGALEALRGAPVPEGLGASIFDTAAASFGARGCARELRALLAQWRSNGRLMTWAQMIIAPGASFPLHCHPNVEVPAVRTRPAYASCVRCSARSSRAGRSGGRASRWACAVQAKVTVPRSGGGLATT
jgi:hypothetical protein